ncbi:basic proline-rich protein-like [Passer montanus]|uniref:basic proline-rich protein-like n=1 Tax=Passer montanus TaxID=9160 RepID=UPI00196061E2|nr:basic proline-rich protein-like [Passer montanus]
MAVSEDTQLLCAHSTSPRSRAGEHPTSPEQEGRGLPQAPAPTGRCPGCPGRSWATLSLHPSGCPVRAVPGGAGPLCPGGGGPGQPRGCAGPGRGPGLLWGSWHCPSHDLARKQRLSPRAVPTSPLTPRPAAPGHLGKTRTPLNLRSQTAPPVEAETPAKPGRGCASFPVPGEPLGPGHRCGIPGRAALVPPVPGTCPPPPRPRSPAGAAPPARAPASPARPRQARPLPPKPPGSPPGIPFRWCRDDAPRRQPRLPPRWEASGGGDAGRLPADPRAETQT